MSVHRSSAWPLSWVAGVLIAYATLHPLTGWHWPGWDAIRWLASIWHARQKAAAEDKPIVICYTGGAGYNEPLGVC